MEFDDEAGRQISKELELNQALKFFCLCKYDINIIYIVHNSFSEKTKVFFKKHNPTLELFDDELGLDGISKDYSI